MAELANLILKLIDINTKVLKKASKIERNIFIIRNQVLAGCHMCGDRPEIVAASGKKLMVKFEGNLPKKCVLEECDWILEAFDKKYRTELGREWKLKEEDWAEVVRVVNAEGCEDWTRVGFGVQAVMIKQNLRKAGKKVPKYDSYPIDIDGCEIIDSWVASKI